LRNFNIYCNFTIRNLKLNKMDYLKNTPENNAKMEALKAVKETQWVGSVTFNNMDECLTSMNLEAMNSGWYKPTPTRIKGVYGIFMINQDGGLYFEQRIIKVADSEYRIESLSNAGFTIFENNYSELI